MVVMICLRGGVSAQAEQPNSVVFEDAGHHFGLECGVLDVAQPAVWREQREVRAEQHPVLQERVRGADELRGKYFGLHPERSIQVLCLWVATERASSCQGTEGCAMMICRSGKSAATASRSIGFDSASRRPAPPRMPRADPGLAGMEERGDAGVLHHVVQRVELLVARVEALHGRVEFEAAHPAVFDEAACAHRRASGAAGRPIRTGSARRCCVLLPRRSRRWRTARDRAASSASTVKTTAAILRSR